MEFQELLQKINEGSLPSLIGSAFTSAQIDEAKAALDRRKARIDEYVKNELAIRLCSH